MGRLRQLPFAALGDLALAAVFASAAQVDVWVRGTVSGPRIENAVLLAFVAPPLAVRRRWPCAAAVVIAAAVATQAIVVGKPPSGFLYWPILIISYSVGAHAQASRRALGSIAALTAAYGVLIGYAFKNNGSSVTAFPWMLASIAPWLLGRAVRRRRERADAAAVIERRGREREQLRLAALEQERKRMARELHDILAHSVSLMGVQAGAAEEVLARDPERARPVLRSIQHTARDSVAELRRLLGILRDAEGEDLDSPQPDIQQLDALVRRMRDAGLPVDLVVDGNVRPLPPGIELTAFRVIQEGLTNALKHARPSRVEVQLRYRPTALDVCIANDGVRADANGAGGGHGLVGMNERVALYGGALVTTERPDGVFSIDAHIPLEP